MYLLISNKVSIKYMFEHLTKKKIEQMLKQNLLISVKKKSISFKNMFNQNSFIQNLQVKGYRK